MTKFKQIIERGTRIHDDYGKLFYTIIEFTQSTRLFANPSLNPAILKVQLINDYGNITEIARYFGGVEQLLNAVNQC